MFQIIINITSDGAALLSSISFLLVITMAHQHHEGRVDDTNILLYSELYHVLPKSIDDLGQLPTYSMVNLEVEFSVQNSTKKHHWQGHQPGNCQIQFSNPIVLWKSAAWPSQPSASSISSSVGSLDSGDEGGVDDEKDMDKDWPRHQDKRETTSNGSCYWGTRTIFNLI